jgi:lysophospholipase L1-like esterase
MIYRAGSWSAELARSAVPWLRHVALGATLVGLGCAGPDQASRQLAPASTGGPESSDDAALDPLAPGNSDSNSDNAASSPNATDPAPGSESAPNAELPLDRSSAPGAAGSGAAGSAEDPEANADPEGTTPSEPPVTAPVNPAELPPVTLWIAGDSTVANGQTPCPRGWGGAIGARLDARVRVNNAAVGGRSVHTWLYEVGQETDDATGECTLARDASGAPRLQARWQTMLDGMRPGDYLLIQFGINDGDPNCDRHVGIGAFQTAYGMMAQAAKARGAQPVFLTPVSSVACTGTTARGSRGGFVPATLEAGAEFDVPVIDLHALSVELYQERGFCPVAGGDVSASTTGAVGDFFCDDHTHFSPTGAIEIAALVARGLQSQRIGLAAYLK